MTYLEVHSDRGVQRWRIQGLPAGKTEEDYLMRIEVLNLALAFFEENMSYAYDNPTVFIVHQSKFD
ncbi:MAG TPA: hypothetical protein VKQ52_00950 [Puia sp.]|nr:hypothetical protein [Puia sp.]